MPKPHFDGRLENYDDWVGKLQQWFAGCDPTYRRANEAHMILSTLPHHQHTSRRGHSTHTNGPHPQRIVGFFGTTLPRV